MFTKQYLLMACLWYKITFLSLVVLLSIVLIGYVCRMSLFHGGFMIMESNDWNML